MKAPRIYISGGMTGLPDLNFPAFNAEAARLRALGYEVENPTEVKLGAGAVWVDYMRVDLKKMLDCDAIALLPGWRESRGARVEADLAVELGFTIIYPDELAALVPAAEWIPEAA